MADGHHIAAVKDDERECRKWPDVVEKLDAQIVVIRL